MLEDVVQHLVERRLQQRGVAPDIDLRVELEPQLHAGSRHPVSDPLRRRLHDRSQRDADREGQLERKTREEQHLVGHSHQGLRLERQALRNHLHLVGRNLVIREHVGVATQDRQGLLDLLRCQPNHRHRRARLAVGRPRFGMQAGRQQPRDDQQEVLVRLGKDARALADDPHGAGHFALRRERGSEITRNPQPLPHRQALERLALARVANIEHAAFHLLIDRRKGVLERHPKSRLDRGPALNV